MKNVVSLEVSAHVGGLSETVNKAVCQRIFHIDLILDVSSAFVVAGERLTNVGGS